MSEPATLHRDTSGSGHTSAFLTGTAASAKHPLAMKSPHILAAVAMLPLAACDHSSTSAAQNSEAAANVTAPPVALPPSITQSVSLRCADDSLVYVDFFEGDTQVNVKTKQDGTPVHLTAPAAGKPYEGQGYTLSGTAKSVDFTQPGKSKQSCKA
jgi:hypothetical protein